MNIKLITAIDEDELERDLHLFLAGKVLKDIRLSTTTLEDGTVFFTALVMYEVGTLTE